MFRNYLTDHVSVQVLHQRFHLSLVNHDRQLVVTEASSLNLQKKGKLISSFARSMSKIQIQLHGITQMYLR